MVTKMWLTVSPRTASKQRRGMALIIGPGCDDRDLAASDD